MRMYGIAGTSELYVVAPGMEDTLPVGAVPVTVERPTPGALLQEDGTWETVPTTPPPEPLDLNGITYDQADAVIRAESVEDLRLAVLDVLGL